MRFLELAKIAPTAGRALVVAAAIAACSPTKYTGPPPDVSQQPMATTTAPDTPSSPSATPLPTGETLPSLAGPPSGFVLIGKDQLASIKRRAAANAPEWRALRSSVDENLGKPDNNRGSTENVALVHLVTGDARYAAAAYKWAQASMTQDVRSGSYLEFGNLMRPVAVTLNYCGAALDAAQKKELADYLDRWTNELWFDNKGSKWGIDDPGNNYHMAFLEGTAFAGYALTAAGDARGKRYVDLALDRIGKPKGVLAYLDTRAKGGDWHEGANYGQRSKERLYAALAVITSMGGPDFFQRSRFFDESIYLAIYQLQPGNGYIHPSGDMARDSTMPVTPFDRDYVQLATYFSRNAAARGYGQWYLTSVAPTYLDSKTFSWRGALYHDVLFLTDARPTPPDKLPLSYQATGTQWISARSGWDAHATNLTVSAPAILDQSHAHVDTGSFTLWKDGWQAPDSVTYSRSGLLWDAGSHNMLNVTGHQRFNAEVPGLTRFADATAYAYFQIDASGLFQHRPTGRAESMLDEYTRELVYLRPDTLVVYDRVAPKPAAKDYHVRFHFPVKPSFASGRYSATSGGGGMSLVVLGGGTPSILEDTDLGDGGSNAFRVQIPPAGDATKGARFLSVLQVASGAAPALTAERITSSARVEGAIQGDQVVVFSAEPKGKPLTSGFSYTVPGAGKRTHTLVDIEGGCNVSVARSGGSTTVTVTPGQAYKASQGVVRFTD